MSSEQGLRERSTWGAGGGENGKRGVDSCPDRKTPAAFDGEKGREENAGQGFDILGDGLDVVRRVRDEKAGSRFFGVTAKSHGPSMAKKMMEGRGKQMGRIW